MKRFFAAFFSTLFVFAVIISVAVFLSNRQNVSDNDIIVPFQTDDTEVSEMASGNNSASYDPSSSETVTSSDSSDSSEASSVSSTSSKSSVSNPSSSSNNSQSSRSNYSTPSNSSSTSSLRSSSSSSASSTPSSPFVRNGDNYVVITDRTLRVVDVSDTTVDCGDHVNRYGDLFLYGHNSDAVFGRLKYLSVGNTFYIISNGKVTYYRVANIITFEKNTETGRLQLNGVGNYMRQVANARFSGVQYDMSLMTCSGTNFGNGDASHRLVIFAYMVR